VLVNAAASNTSITTNDGVKLSLANNGTLIGQPSTINVNTIPVSFVMLHAPGLVTTQTYAIYCQGVTGNGSEAGGTMTLQEIQG
jgi:hypothetical protein